MPKSNLCTPPRNHYDEARTRLFWNIKKNMDLQSVTIEQLALLTGLSTDTIKKKLSNPVKCSFNYDQLTVIFFRLKFQNSEIIESMGGTP